MDQRGLFFTVFIPSFCLLAAVGAPGLDRWSHHREVFGSDNYYLTVEFTGNPEGILTPKTGAHFNGSLVTQSGEFRVSGVRRREGKEWVYEVQSPQGPFEGRLPSGQCPAKMTLTPVSADYPTEKLRAGTCY